MSKEEVKEPQEAQEQQGEQESEPDFVPKKAYVEVTKDLHKFKSTAKELKAQLSEYEARLKNHEEVKLKEQQKWQELYERAKREKEEASAARQKERQMYLRSVKLSALKNELGGKIKDVYLSHANLDGIEISDDGAINPESLKQVANDFRQEHGQLIPKESSGGITGHAPKADYQPKQEKQLSEMTLEEKKNAFRALGGLKR